MLRLDKFLKNSRLIKRRTIAKEACDKGKILVNDKSAKAGTNLQVGDKITLSFGDKKHSVEVLKLLEHAPKDVAESMYKNIN